MIESSYYFLLSFDKCTSLIKTLPPFSYVAKIRFLVYAAVPGQRSWALFLLSRNCKACDQNVPGEGARASTDQRYQLENYSRRWGKVMPSLGVLAT